MISNAISFVAVVKAGSFSKAAAILGVSKSQLSRHVNQLEKSLGIQLLYRTTRSLSLTESGHSFFLRCHEIEENYMAAVDELKQEFTAIKGTLRITAPIAFGSEFLPKIIYQFSQMYPNIKIVLSLSSATENLVEKNFDLSFRIAAQLPDSSLKMRVLSTLDMVYVAAPSYLANIAHPTTIEDLKTLNCTSPTGQTTNVWPYYDEHNNLIKFIPNANFEVDGLRAQIQFLLLGTGIGRVPELFVRKELAQGTLIQLLPNLKQPPLFVYLLYPNRKHLPKKVASFLEFIKNSDLVL
ncbi:LysR family transcriptional regulator [Legionella beliardensis]|uniref:LysR family transcriptional regulator n=1 Tax=Legionella beliardensis TaxID=91822 RepID=A0A378I2F2_9GAMM|nr:LysR family transcriptional regulator [Legionella beliardensis]STX28881.1 LysR family transcriptional regulator [Legionella beliardensis]